MPLRRLVPELVALASPPPVVCVAKPLAVPELVVVALWLVPVALFVKGAAAVVELVQASGLMVGAVHTKSANVGELADKANNESAAAQPSVEVETKKADFSTARRARGLAVTRW
jgi:hypothetical protein